MKEVPSPPRTLLIKVTLHTQIAHFPGAQVRCAWLECILGPAPGGWRELRSRLLGEPKVGYGLVTPFSKIPWDRVVSCGVPVYSYICKYLNSPRHGKHSVQSSLPQQGPGKKPLLLLGWDMLLTQLWGQIPRFVSRSRSRQEAPERIPSLPSPMGALQGATISLGFTRGGNPPRHRGLEPTPGPRTPSLGPGVCFLDVAQHRPQRVPE